MYFNMNGGLGCLILFFIFFLLMSLFGSVLRILFTTPIGIVILFAAGIYLFIRSRQNASINVEERDNKNNDEFEESNSPNFSRDAEDVDFKDIDE